MKKEMFSHEISVLRNTFRRLLRRHAHATGQPDWPWTVSPAGDDRVLVRGRQVTDPIVLNTINAPSHENLVELDQEAVA